MPRKLRVQYGGAIYHLMNRGDRREPIFLDEEDQKMFLAALGQTCEKTDWQIRPQNSEIENEGKNTISHL